MSDLHALLARIEAAEGPDREIDAELRVVLFSWTKGTVAPDFDGKNAGWVWVPPGGLPEGYAYPPRGRIDPMFHARSYHPSEKLNYTTSLDAAVSLCERVLPGWQWRVASTGFAIINPEGARDNSACIVKMDAPTPALALCAAVVKAKMEKHRK